MKQLGTDFENENIAIVSLICLANETRHREGPYDDGELIPEQIRREILLSNLLTELRKLKSKRNKGIQKGRTISQVVHLICQILTY